MRIDLIVPPFFLGRPTFVDGMIFQPGAQFTQAGQSGPGVVPGEIAQQFIELVAEHLPGKGLKSLRVLALSEA